jgi:predicted RNase H-like HicB family nuclease
MSFSSIVRREAGTYVSWCPELDVRSEGRTVEKALVNLDEAVEQFLVLHPQLREHRDAQLVAL